MGKPPAYIFVVRHGFRLDAADKQWHLSSPTPYDPPLTYSGWNQSRLLGARIGEILRSRVAEEDAAAASGSEGGPRRRRRYKVILHSSPFLRCAQTSTAIASGIASHPTPLHGSLDLSLPSESTSTTAGGQDDVHVDKSTLRLDAFLGEWLNPGYFELITPPPGSVMMVASAKAEMLRRENYQSYPHLRANGGHLQSANQLWGSEPPSAIPEKPGLNDMKGMASALPDEAHRHRHRRRHRPYVPPTPTFAISSNAPIPAGYVAHARDACLDIDYQWDSMRPPYEWGNGGEYGEEWTAMHQRFRKGIQNLVDWYSTAPNPSEMVTKAAKQKTGSSTAQSAPAAADDSEDIDVETVVVLVSHGAGCNAMIGAITYQPVLTDVAMSSLTMAVRKSDIKSHVSPEKIGGRPDDVATSLHHHYDLQIFADTDHLRSDNSNASSRSSDAMGGFRGRYAGSFSYGSEHAAHANGVGRSASVNAALSAFRRNREASAVPQGGVTVGSGAVSFINTDLAGRPSAGLWSPDSRTGDDEEDDVDMLLDFSKQQQSIGDANGGDNVSKPLLDSPMDRDARIQPIAPPDALTAAEEAEKLDVLPQLGLGTGGLWGQPRGPPEIEQLRGLTSPKRRWTVNEQN